MKRRNFNSKEPLSESTSFTNSSNKLLEKIQLPSRRDFKNIKLRLPKNRFGEGSVDKLTTENRSFCEEKNKENVLNFVNTNKITRKDQLPTLKRSSSLNNKDEQKIKYTDKITCDDRPPLPKKPIRA